MPRSKTWRKMGKPVLCHYCNRDVLLSNPQRHSENPDRETLGRMVTVEHIYARSAGGTNEPYNKTEACQRCNNLRGNLPYPAFREFAFVVLRQYPDAPTSLLRSALNEFINHLVGVAMTNNRAMRRASGNALLRLGDEHREYLDKRELSGKKPYNPRDPKA